MKPLNQRVLKCSNMGFNSTISRKRTLKFEGK